MYMIDLSLDKAQAHSQSDRKHVYTYMPSYLPACLHCLHAHIPTCILYTRSFMLLVHISNVASWQGPGRQVAILGDSLARKRHNLKHTSYSLNSVKAVIWEII